jgi:predicted DNA-binding transcriptional regulator AlpA
MEGRTERLEDLEFLTREDLVERKIIGRSMSYEYGKKNSKYYDPDFPEPIRIKGRVKFRASEIKAWLEILERRSNKSPRQEKHIPEHGRRTQRRNRSAELSNLVEKTWQILMGVAKSGKLIPYPDAMAHLRLWPNIPADLSLFEEILAEVSTRSYQQGQVLLSVVVSKRLRHAEPSECFFDLAKKLGCDGLDNLSNFIREQRVRLWHQQNPGKEEIRLVEMTTPKGNFLMKTARTSEGYFSFAY